MEPFADYDRHDATGLAELVRARQVHPSSCSRPPPGASRR